MDSFTLEHTSPVNITAKFNSRETMLANLSNVSCKYKKESLKYTNSCENEFSEKFESYFNQKDVNALVDLVKDMYTNSQKKEFEFNYLVYCISKHHDEIFKELLYLSLLPVTINLLYYSLAYNFKVGTEELLKYSLNIDYVDKDGIRPLDVAISTANKNTYVHDCPCNRLIREINLDISYKNYINKSPFHMCLEHYSELSNNIVLHPNFILFADEINYIIEMSPKLSEEAFKKFLNLLNNDRDKFVAIIKNINRFPNISIDQKLLIHEDKFGNTLLYYFVSYGNHNMVDKLINDNEIDYLHTNIFGKNIIQIAQDIYHEDIYIPLLKDVKVKLDKLELAQVIYNDFLTEETKKHKCPLKYLAIKEYLDLELIDVNYQDDEGNTPLMYAVINYDTELVSILLSRQDIHINPANKIGDTPLLILLKNLKRDDETNRDTYVKMISQIFLDKRFSVEHKNRRNDRGETLLITCIKLFFKDRYGVKSVSTTMPYSNELAFSEFDSTSTSKNLNSEESDKSLQNRIYERERQLIESRVNKFTIPNIPCSGPAPFPGDIYDYGCKIKSTSLLKIVEMLLNDSQVNVNIRDDNHKNVLDYVTYYNDKHLFNKLLKHPLIDINSENHCGETTLYSLIEDSKNNGLKDVFDSVHYDSCNGTTSQISPSSEYPMRLVPEFKSSTKIQEVFTYPTINPTPLEGFKNFKSASLGTREVDKQSLYFFIKTLINHPNIDINHQTITGNTYLLLSMDTEQLIFNLLIAHPNISVDTCDYLQESPLMKSIRDSLWYYVIKLVQRNANTECGVDGANINTIVEKNETGHIYKHILDKYQRKDNKQTNGWF